MNKDACYPKETIMFYLLLLLRPMKVYLGQCMRTSNARIGNGVLIPYYRNLELYQQRSQCISPITH